MRRPSPITWLTTLSLDAPLVAIVWQQFFAPSAPLHKRLIIFAAVWLGYTADRWFDSFRYKEPILHRHRFARRNQRPILVAWVAIFVLSVALAIGTLTLQELAAGFALMTLSIIFTFLIQKRILDPFQAFAKPLITAFLISGSVILFSFPLDRFFTSTCLPLASAAFLLFFINCSLIRFWDKDADTRQDPAELRGQAIAKPAAKVSTILLILIIIFILIDRHLPLAIAASLSLLSLLTLDRLSARIPLESRRAYADLALLTPLLFILI
ncbi:MAG: hypothetical protein AAGB46_12735 [Verrucomicrobiota bacterium]